MKNRNYRLDNIRFLLIFLVVFGHLSELFTGQYRNVLYTVIYSFHMPAFIFIIGYYAKHWPARFFRRLAVPYIVFQAAYLLFDYYVLKNRDNGFVLQFTTPYWLMWYMLTVILYSFVLPMLAAANRTKALIIILAGFLCSVLVGFDNTAGYYLSLARTIAFFPFYITGYYFANLFRDSSTGYIARHRRAIIAVTILILAAAEIVLLKLHVSASALYGSFSYRSSGSSYRVRLLIWVCAVSAIILLMLLVPDKNYPVITRIGASTLPVYLLHGFAQRLILKAGVFHYRQSVNLVLDAALTCGILLILGNRYVKKVFEYLF